VPSPLLVVALTGVLLAPIASVRAASGSPRGVHPGHRGEVRGEVVEVGCYLREGSRGEAHKTCARASLENGGQLGIVEDGTGVLYPLSGAQPATDPSAGFREQIGAHVSVRGRIYERAGSRVLVAEKTVRIGR